MLHSTDRAHKQCTLQIIKVQSSGHNDRESQIEVKSGIEMAMAGQIDQNRAFLQKDMLNILAEQKAQETKKEDK